jgi:uncharacterized protein YjaZ
MNFLNPKNGLYKPKGKIRTFKRKGNNVCITICLARGAYMGVIRTDTWLHDFDHKPIEICEKLKEYFEDALAFEIYDHLTLHGMYLPFMNGHEVVKPFQKNKVWEIVQEENLRLQKEWGGPNIPIFIFPADKNNQQLKQNFNGKSGLAYKDKLFLFLPEDITKKELRALFTHEYNHVCRLFKLQNREEDDVLLDSIILEGLAENAVRERLGEECLAAWTSYYSNEDLKKMWNQFVLPNKKIRKHHPNYPKIIYGLQSYPKMAGYCVGYYLVQNYVKDTSQTSKQLLDMKADMIAQIK